MNSLLEIRNLSVKVDGETILHNINLTISEGNVNALLGPNGSGKTSLMMTIMGFSRYEVIQGQILFNGEEITEQGLTERARLGIGIALQRPPTITGVKLRQILDYIIDSAPKRYTEMKALVKTVHMETFLDREINDGLSGGEIKRSELLQLLVTNPRFAMMDEPDSGVDMDALKLVGNMVNTLFSRNSVHPEKKRTGLIVTHTGHIMDYIQADNAHVMMNGHIVCSGNPHLILDTIRDVGYEECVRCTRENRVVRLRND